MNKKFGLLIWSYNRSAQLDLLLSSIERFSPCTFDIFALYKAKGNEFAAGYEICQRYHPDVNWVDEYDFNAQTKEILSYRDYFGVSTDDTVVYKPFTLQVEDMRNIDIFSLRYGFNTTVQDPFTQIIQPALTRYTDEGNTICWDSRFYHPLNNYGFQFGHDLHVYSKKYRELIADVPFKKANELESWLFNNCRDKVNPFIRSFRTSVAVNLPLNNTSGYTETLNLNPLEYNNQNFLNGKRFRMDEILNTKIVGCHQNLQLVME